MTAFSNVQDVGAFSGATRLLLDSQAGLWNSDGASLNVSPDGAQQLGSGLIALEVQTDVAGVETCTVTLVVEDAADDGAGAPVLPFVAVPAANFMTAADGADGLPAPLLVDAAVSDSGQLLFTLPFHRCRSHVRVTTDVVQSNAARVATICLEAFDGGNVLAPR
jgi:hypothetical protein